MRQVIGLFLATRAVMAITVVAALAFLTPTQCDFCVDGSTTPLLAGLARWDAAAYIDIARDGYEGAGRESNAAYSPLYPILVRVGGILLGGSGDAFIVAGVLVANAALVIALVALLRLAATRVDAHSAMRSVAYVAIFPTTIFLSAAYAESLFLALAVLSALEAERARWWRSGAYAALAGLTRPFGAVAVLPLAFALWRSRRSTGRATFAAIAPAPLAFAAWSAYVWRISGDPLGVLHVYAAWGSAPRSPLGAFADLFDRATYGFPWFVLGSFVLFVVLVAMSWRVTGPGLGTYATSLLFVLAGSGSLTSSMRYELAIFPAFIVLGATTLSRPLRLAWVVVSACLAVVFTAMFALYLWVG